MTSRCLPAAASLALLLALAACASHASARAGAGVGTPGITSYAQAAADPNVKALEARCRLVPRATHRTSDANTIQAACAQLGRLRNTQPGNSIRPGASE